MKRFFVGLLSTSILFSISEAATTQNTSQIKTSNPENTLKFSPENKSFQVQQNLIGEVTGVDSASGKITIKSESGTVVIISFNDKTAFRRVMPGQTSIANAQLITISDITTGDRVLIPGGSANEQTPVRQVIVMPRAAINAQRNQELENRRARTVNGRVTGVNPENREIIIQARGGGAGAQTITVSAAENVKLLRYAPDSLKVSDAVAGSFTDLQVGDQIRILGDRNPEGTRITAEEIISGSFVRSVGSIVEINAPANEITVKNSQTGQTMRVAIGKNTTLRRIPEEVAETLRQRMNQRAERQRTRGNRQNTNNSSTQQTPEQQNNRQNRRENRRGNNEANRTGQPGQANRGGQLFENLPTVTIGELKKGDAVIITASGGADSSRLTAVSIISGDAELEQILMRTGGRNNAGPGSPGLPGNVSGGNTVGDDEPRN